MLDVGCKGTRGCRPAPCLSNWMNAVAGLGGPGHSGHVRFEKPPRHVGHQGGCWIGVQGSAQAQAGDTITAPRREGVVSEDEGGQPWAVQWKEKPQRGQGGGRRRRGGAPAATQSVQQEFPALSLHQCC